MPWLVQGIPDYCLILSDKHPAIFRISYTPVMEKEKIIGNIVKKSGVPDIVDLLTERLSGSELNSLLLEVFTKRLSGLSPALLLKQYQANRFVHPAETDMVGLLELELRTLKFLREYHFQPIELSPVAQLGSCAVVAPVDQKKIISATRNTELLADATNTIALHIADYKKSGRGKGPTSQGKEAISGRPPMVMGEEWGARKERTGAAGGTLRFCTVHRHTRAQELKGEGFTAHFKIGCLVSSGLDRGNCEWECVGLEEHIVALHNLFMDCYGVGKIWFKLWSREGYRQEDLLMERVSGHLERIAGNIRVIREEAPGKNDYYKGIQFKMMMEVNGREMEIADGGFVDWTQQLLENGKERLLISGFGLGLLYKLQQGMI
jgi:hypothetical protein